MEKMKYIMINNCRPVLFCGSFSHAEMADGCCKGRDKVTGAGFCYIYKHGEIICCGESTSLGGIKPAVGDSYFIEESLGIDTDDHPFHPNNR